MQSALGGKRRSLALCSRCGGGGSISGLRQGEMGRERPNGGMREQVRDRELSAQQALQAGMDLHQIDGVAAYVEEILIEAH